MDNYKKEDILKILFGAAVDQEARDKWKKLVKLSIQYKLWEKANHQEDPNSRSEEISLAQKEAALNEASQSIQDLCGLTSMLIKMSGFHPQIKALESIITAKTGISFAYEASKLSHRLIERNRLEEHKRLIVAEVRRKMRDKERWIAFKKSLKTRKQKTR